MNTTELKAFKSKTMSSTEIAQLTGKEHKNVIADIRTQIFTGLYDFRKEKMANFSAINEIQGVTVILDNRGYWSEVQLDRYHTDILISGYEVKYRAAIVKRWHELESQQPALPETKLEWMLLAVENEKAKQALQNTVDQQNEEIAVLEPKAQALDRLSAADGSMNVTAAAKVLKMQPKQLFKLLSEKRWIYRRAGGKSWLGYQDKIQSGYLEHIPTTLKRPDGTEKVTEQVLVTAKGLSKLSTMLNPPLNAIGRVINNQTNLTLN